MGMTLDEALTDARIMLRDHAGFVADDSILKSWLDQGTKDVAALTLIYQKVLTLTSVDSPQALSVGQRNYPFAVALGSGGLGLSDELSVMQVTRNGLPLMRWVPTMIGIADTVDTRGGGTPGYYYEFGEQLTFLPYPDAAFLAMTWTMEITYGARPPTWTSGPSPLPSAFDQLPVLFAISRVAMQHRHWPFAAHWYGQYLAQIQQFRTVSMLQYTTTQLERIQPIDEERQDEPRRLVLMRRQRRQRGQ